MMRRSYNKERMEKLGLQTNDRVIHIPSQKYLIVYDRRPIPPRELNDDIMQIRFLLQ